MARAVYQNADIYLMDDPVSALDVNVRKKIFKQVINGLLRDKTRILATHATDFLTVADRVIIMKKGRIVANVPRGQLMTNPLIKALLVNVAVNTAD